MNTFRRMLFFFLAVFIFAGAYDASATHFDITYDTPLNFTSSLKADGTFDAVLNLSFNLTNTSELSVDTLDGFNLTNVTIYAVLANGTEVELGVNNTGNNDFLEITDRILGFTYRFDKVLVLNASIIPPEQEGSIPLNITVEAYNGTNTTVEFNESITFLSYAVFLDVTPPDVTVTFRDQQDNDKTKFEATDKVKIVCTRASKTANSDAAQSLRPSFNHTNISIQTAAGGSFDALDLDEGRATGSTEFVVTFSDTLELGDYTVACYSIDDLGGINDTTNASFSIVKKPPRSTSAFANKDFKKPEGQKIVTETEDVGKVPVTGFSRLMRQGSSVKVDVKGESHTVTLKSLTPTAVTLTVASQPFDVTINKGETKDVDVDRDGQNDLAITFHQQFKSGGRATADITIKEVSTPATPKKDTTKEPTTPKTEQKTAKSGFAGGAVVAVIVIVAIIVIGFALIRGKKK